MKKRGIKILITYTLLFLLYTIFCKVEFRKINGHNSALFGGCSVKLSNCDALEYQFDVFTINVIAVIGLKALYYDSIFNITVGKGNFSFCVGIHQRTCE